MIRGTRWLTGLLFGLQILPATTAAAQNVDSLMMRLDSPDWRERSIAAGVLGRLPASQRPPGFADKVIALLEYEALNPDEAAIAGGEGYGEYIAELARVVLGLDDPRALRGIAIAGIGTSRAAKDFVASHGAASLPYLDEAWDLDRYKQGYVALTWAGMLARFPDRLDHADRIQVLARLISVAEYDTHVFSTAASTSGLGELVAALQEIAENDPSARRRAFATYYAAPLLAARDALSPSELHARMSDLLEAVCLDAAGGKLQTCATLQTYLNAGYSNGNALDTLAQQAELAEQQGILKPYEEALFAGNAQYLITSQHLTVTRSVSASADTYIRLGDKNANSGSGPILRVQRAGDNRALLRFDKADIAAVVGSGTLISAKLAFMIVDNGNNWGPEGRTVEVIRLTQAWTESGATWNCATDTDTNNNQPDCPDGAWEMSDVGPNPWEPTASATMFFTNDLTGVVQFDVTADVQAFLDDAAADFGWIVIGTDTLGSGTVDFSSRENASPPQLLLEIQF